MSNVRLRRMAVLILLLGAGGWWWTSSRGKPTPPQPERGDGPEIVLFHTATGDTGIIPLERYMVLQEQLQPGDSVQILTPHRVVLFDATLAELKKAVFDTVIVRVRL